MAVQSDQRVNMVPLIDTMLFLILFFIIAMRFHPDEQQISSLLPTDEGPVGSASKPLAAQVNIAVYPLGLERHQGLAYYQHVGVDAQGDGGAELRIGGSQPIALPAL